nr:arylesterase [Pseudomonas fluorescens]
MSTFVAKDGTQIYFKDWGSGKPVLFSHGWPLDADMWEYQMEYLSSRGYRTIAFDRPVWPLGPTLDRQRLRHLRRRHRPVDRTPGPQGGDPGGLLHGRRRCGPLHRPPRQRTGGRPGAAGRRHPAVRPEARLSAGCPVDVFARFKTELLKDRAQFISDFNAPFYGINKGQVVSQGVQTQTLQIALLASLKATVDCVTGSPKPTSARTWPRSTYPPWYPWRWRLRSCRSRPPAKWRRS